MRLLPLWQKQWVALAIRMKRLHLLDRDDLKDPYALVRVDCDEGLIFEQGGYWKMPRYNIREDNPVKYTQVKAEQERLRAGVSR